MKKMTDYGKAKISLEKQSKYMSEAYWKLWNPKLQKEIDTNIEKYRKADASVSLKGLKKGTKVKVEQLSHSFIFGAHIFNFDQLGTDERNRRYKELYGTLFNSATIAFYWKQFELVEGKPRFKGEFRDTAEYWNNLQEPKTELHWRRPATDPIVEFCESKGIRLHGHTLTWGNKMWQIPPWLTEKMPAEYRSKLPDSNNHSAYDIEKFFAAYSPAEIEKMMPEYVKELNMQMLRRIAEIAMYYKGRLHSWDIVNESATDFEKGNHIPNDSVCKSWYGLMPGDYTYRSFKAADAYFPKDVKLNINDYNLKDCYVDQVKDLRERGCKIDIVGAQMHLFNPETIIKIAEGKDLCQCPEQVTETMQRLGKLKLPIHLSEITITSPNGDERGESMQSIIARNLYRLWFSVPEMMGITWWNVVDGCGAPGEPAISGLFSRDMEPKLAYYTLNDLIHKEWKTNTEVKAESNGKLEFRGFRGKYRLSWTDESGKECTEAFELN